MFSKIQNKFKIIIIFVFVLVFVSYSTFFQKHKIRNNFDSAKSVNDLSISDFAKSANDLSISDSQNQSNKPLVEYKKINLNKTEKRKPKKNYENKDKWIVVTSIFEPTDQIKKLASLKNFQLLVVGDKKTNQNWKYENSIFLSIKEQEKLNFNVFENVPFNSYTRKIIGKIEFLTYSQFNEFLNLVLNSLFVCNRKWSKIYL